jgi:hypothetical protein
MCRERHFVYGTVGAVAFLVVIPEGDLLLRLFVPSSWSCEATDEKQVSPLRFAPVEMTEYG